MRNVGNLGAYVGAVGANIPTANFTRCLPGMYNIKLIDVSTKCVFTNTLPTAPYRGAGRPEASYILERVVDEAARLSGIDPVKLRRRNMIKKSAMPYKTAVGTTYDSGDFEPILDKALELADHNGFKQRKREAARRGKHRGFGICCLLEHAGGAPTESAMLTFPGNETLLIESRRAEYRPGPRHRVPRSHQRAPRHSRREGRASPRQLGVRASRLCVGRLALGHDSRSFAGQGDGYHHRQGQADRGHDAGNRRRRHRLQSRQLRSGRHRSPRVAVPGGGARRRDEEARRDRRRPRHQDHHRHAAVFPNGVHIAEVEIDPDTGAMEIATYTAVDDCGRALDHTIVEGQLHGSVAAGLGQALMENIVYDEGNGQLVTGSFIDYAMPRADDMPPLRDAMLNVPATTNPLGVKGVGEAGTTAAISAVMNAVADAIPDGGGAHLDMPASAARLWAACQAEKNSR